MKQAIKFRVTGILLVCLFTVLAILAGCQPDNRPPMPPDVSGQAEEEEPVKEPVTLCIGAVGDIMIHKPQLESQRDSDDSYSFDNNFEYIKPFIEEADLALCNVETTFAGKERGYSGYPVFNSPDELAVDLKEAGFDVAVTANNHCLDMGSKGVIRTIEQLKAAGFPVAGTHLENEPRYTIVEVKGVKVGVVAYTYETPQTDGRRGINAIPIPESMLGVINSFGYETLEEDTAKIKDDMREAKKAGAEVLVCFMHWGIEYQNEPSKEDQRLAAELVGAGADIIFASHPHVIQPIEIMTSADGRQVPVFYSMGNFLSNQRLDTVDNRKTEDGMMAFADIRVLDGKVSFDRAHVISTWVNKYKKDGKLTYDIIPIINGYEENPSVVDSKHKKQIVQSKEDSLRAVGQFWDSSISPKE